MDLPKCRNCGKRHRLGECLGDGPDVVKPLGVVAVSAGTPVPVRVRKTEPAIVVSGPGRGRPDDLVLPEGWVRGVTIEARVPPVPSEEMIVAGYTVVKRDKAKQAAYMRAYRAKKKRSPK